MFKIPSKLDKIFHAITKRAGTGVIIVSDTPDHLILFNSNLKNLLAYNDQALTGKPADFILPLDVRGAYENCLGELKLTQESASFRETQLLHQNRSAVTLSVATSYHRPPDPSLNGFFVALIQDPMDLKVKTLGLESLLTDFDGLVGTLVRFRRWTVKKIVTWVSAAGIGSVLLFGLTLTKESVGVWTAIRAVWEYRDRLSESSEVSLVKEIDNDLRQENLEKIRSELISEFGDSIYGVAYYELVGDLTSQLRYRGDSGGVRWVELFFWDRYSGENAIIFTRQMSDTLTVDEDCLYIGKGGSIPDRPQEKGGTYTYASILCPTVRVIQTESGLYRFEVVGATAVGLSSTISKEMALSRIGGILFNYSPSLQSLVEE